MIYSQSAATIRKDDGTRIDTPLDNTYAGYGIGRNNHACESIAFTGPLPCGVYDCGPVVTNQLGTDVFALTPDPANRMFGRSGFWCHDDDPARPPQTSSDGCLVTSRVVRLAMKATSERLHVMP